MVVLSMATTALMGWIGWTGVMDFFDIGAATLLEWVAMTFFLGMIILMAVLVWATTWAEWD